MLTQAKTAPVMSTNFLGGMVVCNTQGNELPVDYGILTESIFSIWSSGEIDRLVISWARTEVPVVEVVNEHDLPDQPNVLASSQEVKLNLQSNNLRFRDLQDSANELCGDSSGYDSEFWLALEFDNRLVTVKKKVFS